MYRHLTAKIAAEYPGTDLWIYRASAGHVVVGKLVVPRAFRKRGWGTAIMQLIIDLADRQGDTLSLTPSPEFGATSAARLWRFYHRFGFVSNLGGDMDYAISDSMRREPK